MDSAWRGDVRGTSRARAAVTTSATLICLEHDDGEVAVCCFHDDAKGPVPKFLRLAGEPLRQRVSSLVAIVPTTNRGSILRRA